MTEDSNMELSPLLQEKINEWIRWDKNETTTAALQKLIDAKDIKQIEKIMVSRIKFGTAGLRGKMGLGYGNINDLVIIQTAQGWLKFLEVEREQLLKNNGIVVGYDGRHNSRRWAELTASVFAHSGYIVKLLGKVCPTPFISYAIGKFKCAGGAMITASHNPKDDNGYKVYDSNACQIINPVDKKIQLLILENLEPWHTSWDQSILQSTSLISNPLAQLTEDYIKLVSGTILEPFKEVNRQSELIFTYTAMHGVGYPYIKGVLDAVGVKMLPVEEQKDPDPEFPTVKIPNPEEGESCLNLAFKAADKNGSLLVIANDPDADRFAFAEKNKVTGNWRVFTGNELGALFGWWMLYCHQIRNPTEAMENIYMMSSTVSSMILKTMAKKHGFNFLETLTGFKWMGNKVIELHEQHKRVLLGYEAEIGYMCVPQILDKDGVSAAAHYTTLCSFVYSQGKQVHQKLEEIYNTYGYHICRNAYFSCSDHKIIKGIFERIRNFNGNSSYPSGILNDKYKVICVRDLTTGYDSSEPDKKAKLPLSPEMVTFTFDNGFIITLRTSGTENKIKYYSEICADSDIKDEKTIRNTFNLMVDEVLAIFLQPIENGLL
ncbi:phosphopentomutase-like [Euwallacea similis]|uniref:phosphopentomutase-like n=1 Tax=Euwallacea similis TaxID=1736056 RepID=UPI00344E0826